MSPAAKRDLAQSALDQLLEIDVTNADTGERTLQRILQPLFALSGYRLRAEPVSKAETRFDLVGENLLGGDDRVLVEFRFTRQDVQRSMVSEPIRKFVSALDPKDPTRVILIGNTGFEPRTVRHFRDLVGPRLELWSFDDVRIRLEELLAETDRSEDAFIRVLTEFLDKLALGIASAEIDARQIEWRQIEQLVAHVLRELGYAVALTSSSHDGGRDLIVADVTSSELGVFNIEVKHWTEQPIGKREVRRLLEVSLRERREGALMLATSGASASALQVRTEAMVDYLRIGDDRKIALTCRTFARKRQGIWSGTRPFQSFLLEGTV